MKRITVLTVMALVFSVVTAQATPILYDPDPADLHIGSPPNSGAFLYNVGDQHEVRPIDSDGFGILLNGHNGTTLDSPLLLILGIPNTTILPSLISGTDPASTPLAPVYRGSMMAGEEVYGFLGLGDKTNDSNSFTNWAAAELAVNGITAQYFGIFQYDLVGAGIISGGSTVDISFFSTLPQGTFAVAYGTTHRVNNDGVNVYTPFTTPFTEAGLTRDGGGPPNEVVPEPGTFILTGLGLAALGLYRRTRRS